METVAENCSVALVNPPKKKMDKETVRFLLIQKRIAELELEQVANTNKKLTMNVLTDKDHRQQQYTNKQLVRIAMQEGNIGSKALPAQYQHKADTTHDKTASAVRHHTGSHYHMAGSVQFQRGVRVKGVVSRHSKQAAVRNGKKSKANKQKSASSLGMLGQA